MPLTETDIKTFKANAERERWENDGDGLYLPILRTGRMSWVWRTKKHGKTRYRVIGEWPALSVKQARAELVKRKGPQDAAQHPQRARRTDAMVRRSH